jgi:hypothetical protein
VSTFSDPFLDSMDVQLASGSVNVSALNEILISYIRAVARAHRALFGLPLIITSGNDGQHVAGSAHALNRAVDIRSHDLQEEDQLIFGLILAKFAELYKMAVFDERFTAAPHWHVQTVEGTFVS